ncbi:hypothetical protein AVEN_247852-1 [Araneus ventricosus]|uniref:Uncharacterized protein n=1 Tax=Araneus ventricosus TaxID=182803 RepID=A0A4Y2IFT4_ARAVE|nr:hypothetical protein AVEN_247852-1 [Araneus ventricosus]
MKEKYNHLMNTLTPLYTPELGTQGFSCQLNGYKWKEVLLPQGDMIDLTSVLASVKSSSPTCDVSKQQSTEAFLVECSWTQTGHMGNRLDLRRQRA